MILKNIYYSISTSTLYKYNIIKEMIEYILIVALILFSVGYYKLHYKPKK
jgi:uncharacterized membrane protein